MGRVRTSYPDAVSAAPEPSSPPFPTGSAGVLLSVAAVVVAAEAVAYGTVAVLDLADVSGARRGFGLGAGLLLVGYGAGLIFAAWRVRLGHAWARAPLVVAQLIQVLVANDARDGAAWVSPAMAASALVVLGCLLAPSVTRSLSADRPV